LEINLFWLALTYCIDKNFSKCSNGLFGNAGHFGNVSPAGVHE